MMRQLRVGKMRPKSMGPYTFVRYKGRLCTTAQLRSPSGNMVVVSVGHLLPVTGCTAQRDEDAGAAGPGRAAGVAGGGTGDPRGGVL